MKVRTITFLFSCLLTGCANVSVIQPVAHQNLRNAQALQTNLESFFLQNDLVFKPGIDNFLHNFLEDYFVMIESNDNPQTLGMDAIIQFYKDKKNAFQQEVASLPPTAREDVKDYYREKSPISAQVAFHELSPEDAAKTWISFYQTYNTNNTNLPRDLKYKVSKALFSDLHLLRIEVQARNDILDAYDTYRKTILEQSNINLEISMQLVNASQSGTSGSKFLRGVTENPKLIETIGRIALEKTKDPDRMKTAMDMLEDLKNKTN